MRIKNEKQNIDYNNTKAFFNRRANKYNASNPYSVTMYQDNDPELVNRRNSVETQKLIKLLNIDRNSRVLDLACGIGRWADALGERIHSYIGIDFSEDLIEIAQKRNKNPDVSFVVGSVTELDSLLDKNSTFNIILIIGAMMYLNDEDTIRTLEQVEKRCDSKARICIREPIGIESRLTLKDFYSKELDDNYNAIYRTRDELIQLMIPNLLNKGFAVEEEGFLFDENRLNNRKETSQYYFILNR